MEKIHVCIIGSGNLGTALGKILAENAAALSDFEERVNMFVYDELFDGIRLSDLINSHHINEKYLPQIQLPDNLVACTDLVETAKYADIIVFVMPKQFIEDFCKTLLGKIKPNAMAISVIKGFVLNEGDDNGGEVASGSGIQLISQTIMKYLKIPCAVLMGVNLASELTLNRYCEATLGCRDMKHSKMLKDLFSTPNFRVIVIDDADAVEVCGYLKHLIAFASGILDGLQKNENTKSACLRFALIEMLRFIDVFYPGCKLSTLFESCGIADVLTVCAGSRNRRLGEAFAKSDRSIEQLETSLMGGEQVLGPLTANAVYLMLQQKGLQERFPLFTIIHRICKREVKPEELLHCIATMPNIIYHPTQIFPL
ncbi:glycerol-3-phosphate dehydrogenase [NAD(+)], cytoplasmic-like [Musca domestica]|uniref:Glycerol-3-phosphate dehydrogenase [NAD(+)] n=1 Tax=Musca domestica TaxID=7370 RepID=A0ABM3VIJ1_MUSDO|nr:glycerol-3-phosphate dehydrogenase [NAD(+)], cytoplasmic-like [Musca domestica]